MFSTRGTLAIVLPLPAVFGWAIHGEAYNRRQGERRGCVTENGGSYTHHSEEGQ